MSTKLTEFAELLKAAKRSTKQKEEVIVPTHQPVEENVVEEHLEPFEDVLEETVISNLPERITSPVQPQEPIIQPQIEKPNLFMQQMQKEIQLLRKMVEESAHRQSIYQPTYSGGGADSTADIHRPSKSITTSYTPTTRDWYIGVGNRDEIITITLPTAIKNGREYVIKDEVGIAQLVPIRIVGTIDTDPEGIELRINYGSVTLFYHNGWRII